MQEKAPLAHYRAFLKDTIRREVDFAQTDQSRGVAPPPIEKPFPPEADQIPLTKPGQWRSVAPIPLETAIRHRQSRRRFLSTPFDLDELSFLLWATQGVRQRIDSATALRTVPSAGARHALETYLCVRNVPSLSPGIYRYLPLEHRLLFEFSPDAMTERLVEATYGQSFFADAAVTFLWTAIPYRMEWRYGLASHKVIALDAGHVCQNLYLACEAVGAGTCAVAAYDQQRIDRFLRVDGTDEFTIYLAPVGKTDD